MRQAYAHLIASRSVNNAGSAGLCMEVVGCWAVLASLSAACRVKYVVGPGAQGPLPARRLPAGPKRALVQPAGQGPYASGLALALRSLQHWRPGPHLCSVNSDISEDDYYSAFLHPLFFLSSYSSCSFNAANL